MEAFKVAYPDVTPNPKHHYAFHLEEQHEEEGMLPGGFPTERRHKLYKGYVREHTIDKSFEKTISMENDWTASETAGGWSLLETWGVSHKCNEA